MNRYGTVATLRNNQVYLARLTIKGEEHTVEFTSRYTPMYSTARMIRGDFKQLFQTVTDDEINRLIHDNSKLAQELANPAFTESAVPYYVRQYVRYKTELDLATGLLVGLSTQGGRQDKTLGDLQISKELTAPDIKQIVELLQKRLEAWEFQLVGMRATPIGATRAGGSEYPITTARLF